MTNGKLLQNDKLRLDVEEMTNLAGLATRQKVKDSLSIEIRKLETEMSRLKEIALLGENVGAPKPVVPASQRCYTVKLDNYAWDQSDNFVKIFLTLKNVQSLPAENIVCTFTERSVDININGLENRNYVLAIKKLLEKIDGTKSHWKVKTDMVVVLLGKSLTGQRWSHLTAGEKGAKESKVPKMEEDGDPSAGLMQMMRQMYEDGDDDMKRTIAKAWTESRSNTVPSF